MVSAKPIAALEDAERAHQDDPERAEILRRARVFKTSWVELAEALVRVKRSRSHEAWGYASFDEYAKRELRLRQETVDKLTGSFLFLKERAPDILERDGLTSKIPSYAAVDFLRRAEAREGAPREVVDQLRASVLEHPVSMPTLSKKFAPQIFPPSRDERRDSEHAALRAAAERLRNLLGESSAPTGLEGELASLLERYIEALPGPSPSPP